MGMLSGISTFEYPGYNMGIMYLYDPRQNVASISIRYADVPKEKIPALYELFNHINAHLIFNHFTFESFGPLGGMILLKTGLKVTEYFLNKTAFKALLKELMGAGHTFMPLIGELLFTDKTPTTIMDEFYRKKVREDTRICRQGWKSENARGYQGAALYHPWPAKICRHSRRILMG